MARKGEPFLLALGSTLVSLVMLILAVLRLAYVCFDATQYGAAPSGCTGTSGANWLAGASLLCLPACPVLSFLAFVAGIAGAIRR